MMRRPLPPGLKSFVVLRVLNAHIKVKLLYDEDHIFAKFPVILEFLALYWQKLEYQHVQDDLYFSISKTFFNSLYNCTGKFSSKSSNSSSSLPTILSSEMDDNAAQQENYDLPLQKLVHY
jgi:hypothetical protein